MVSINGLFQLFHLLINGVILGVITRLYMDVSRNTGTHKSSILIGFSIINHPFWGTPIFGNTHILTFDPNFRPGTSARSGDTTSLG